MVRRTLVVLCFAFMTVFMASCGQTYELQSITVSPTSATLEGLNAPQALTVTAHYSNTKTQDVTAASTYTVVPTAVTILPPKGAVSVNTSGIVQSSPTIVACTFETVLNPDGTTYSYPVTAVYLVTVAYSGQTATANIYVDSAFGCHDPGNPAPPPATKT